MGQAHGKTKLSVFHFNKDKIGLNVGVVGIVQPQLGLQGSEGEVGPEWGGQGE